MTDTIPDKPETNRLYRVSPSSLIVIGHDTPDGEGHELWDERVTWPLCEEQVLSFIAVGVREPCLVRRGLAGRIEVVDGRRRTIESREANRRLLAMGEPPITLFVYFSSARLSPELLLTLSVELNERRTQDPPSVKARKAKRMLDRGIPMTTVSRAFGKSKKTIQDWLKTLDAPADVVAAVDLGMIPSSAAAELVKAPAPVEALEVLIAEPKPGRARAAAIATAQRQKTGHGARLPHGAVRRVLASPKAFSREFVRGVRFAKGALSATEVEKIMRKIEP